MNACLGNVCAAAHGISKDDPYLWGFSFSISWCCWVSKLAHIVNFYITLLVSTLHLVITQKAFEILTFLLLLLVLFVMISSLKQTKKHSLKIIFKFWLLLVKLKTKLVFFSFSVKIVHSPFMFTVRFWWLYACFLCAHHFILVDTLSLIVFSSVFFFFLIIF